MSKKNKGKVQNLADDSNPSQFPGNNPNFEMTLSQPGLVHKKTLFGKMPQESMMAMAEQ